MDCANPESATPKVKSTTDNQAPCNRKAIRISMVTNPIPPTSSRKSDARLSIKSHARDVTLLIRNSKARLDPPRGGGLFLHHYLMQKRRGAGETFFRRKQTILMLDRQHV